MRILITAGATKEYIDPVRFISNASSGRMGYALVCAALSAGHKVTLITTLESSKFEFQSSKLKAVKVKTAAQMFKAVQRKFLQCDCLIMAAAVADYTPIHQANTKIKKQNKPLTIKLKPTVDILKWAGTNKTLNFELRTSNFQRRRVVVGFALEDKNLRQNAEKKMREKNLDMIIANTPAAIGADKTSIQVKTAQGRWLKLPKASKTTIAKKIVSLIEKTYC